MDKYYLTTPLYYVNSKPHIGHSYTEIAADALARWNRLLGNKVLFLTGTDEHGQKVAKAAEAAGMTPQEFTDKISGTFRDLWKKLNISEHEFIRTTEDRHIKSVQEVWRELHRKGQIYKHTYDGFYCVSCENFFTEGFLLVQEGKNLCADCKRPVDRMLEDNYFFKISEYQPWLIKAIHHDSSLSEDEWVTVLPDTRRNEVLGFLNNKLQNLCISRPKSRLSWGIPSPISDEHITYVWFDALINYISACGYPDREKMKEWWPADVHLIGKDILRHHAVYWPILLKALGLPLPKMIFAHGWWVQGGEKMSKSRGNVVDPVEIVKTYGVDAYRYFLLSEATFGEDGVFSEEALIKRFNSDLANNLGNLISRALTMCEKYFDGSIPRINFSKQFLKGLDFTEAQKNAEIKNNPFVYKCLMLAVGSEDLARRLPVSMREFDFSGSLKWIWVLVDDANKFIEEVAPWSLSKQNKIKELELALLCLMEVLKKISQAISPFMPLTAETIWEQLGLPGKPNSVPFDDQWGFFEKGGNIAKGRPLFPRIETKA